MGDRIFERKALGMIERIRERGRKK